MDASEKKSSLNYWIIVILVAAILLANVLSIITTFQQNAVTKERAASYAERVNEAQSLVNRQQEIILDLVSNYESVAYDNPGVDRIAEQQLLAAKFQLQALQILAIQNRQIIELLSAIP